MQVTVGTDPTIQPNGVYEPCHLAELSTYSGTNESGEEYTSFRFDFDMPDEGRMVIFTSSVVAPRSRAGQIFAGILGRDLTPGEDLSTEALNKVPLRLTVGVETKRSGGEKNTILHINRSDERMYIPDAKPEARPASEWSPRAEDAQTSPDTPGGREANTRSTSQPPSEEGFEDIPF